MIRPIILHYTDNFTIFSYRPILLDVYCTLRVPKQPLAAIRNKTTILLFPSGRWRYIDYNVSVTPIYSASE